MNLQRLAERHYNDGSFLEAQTAHNALIGLKPNLVLVMHDGNYEIVETGGKGIGSSFTGEAWEGIEVDLRVSVSGSVALMGAPQRGSVTRYDVTGL